MRERERERERERGRERERERERVVSNHWLSFMEIKRGIYWVKPLSPGREYWVNTTLCILDLYKK